MTDGFYHKKNDGADRDSMGRLYFGGVAARFGPDDIAGHGGCRRSAGYARDCSCGECRQTLRRNIAWKKYLARELDKTKVKMQTLAEYNAEKSLI
jgi:hypothetical protein